MKTNVDDIVAQALMADWKVELTIRGKEYSVRPLTNTDVMALDGMSKLTPADQAKLVESFFEQPIDAGSLNAMEVAVVLGEIHGAIQRATRSLFRRVVAQASAATLEPTPARPTSTTSPASSTKPSA